MTDIAPTATPTASTSTSSSSSEPGQREFDIVVLGATGLTGQLVVQNLIDIDRERPGRAMSGRWAVAGRNTDRLTAMLTARGAPQVPTVVADATSVPSLASMASRTAVVLNLAGPYTPTAESVIEACLDAGTSYADLSGELPLMRRVNDRFHQRARAAGVQVVQMAGWEAFPADLVTLLACEQAATATDDAHNRWGPDGPGASDPIRRVDITAQFIRTPAGGPSQGNSVSAGTLASIVAILDDPGSRIVGDPAGLLPDSGSSRAVRSTSPLRLRPRIRHRRLLGPFTPVAFLDPPVLHRTAALLAEEHATAHRPATVAESMDLGPVGGVADTITRLARTGQQSAIQRALVQFARLPRTLRQTATRLARTRLPEPGTGPSGHHRHDWAWTVRADATATTGAATLEGRGHPGYTATAAMIVVIGRHLAGTDRGDLRTGCLTPALALGARAAQHLSAPGLEMRTEVGHS